MSICSNSVRAFSRSRSSQTKTLLPFLYQTPTIQQLQPATQSIARRNIYTPSRPYVREDIPFENETDLPPPIDRAPSHKTTITRTERAAFQKLYRKVDAEGRQQKKKDHAVELDQVADEHYKNEKDNTKPSLDKVFDEALKGQPRLRALRTERTKARSTKEDVAKLKEIGLAERERIDKLIRNAPTDRALWQTLEREVFTKVRDLDLDNASGGPTKASTSKTSSDTLQKASKAKPPHKPDPPSTDARIFFHNYPYHLITAIVTLRTEFPSSTLPFSILPTIKKLGRSSHALGATTTLYKHLIRTAWIQQCSYTTINMLLSEMDNNAIEFDADILGLIDAIIKEHNLARSGGLGREMALLYGMDMFAADFEKMVTWRKVIAERLGLRSEEKRAASTIVRKTTQAEEKTWRGVGWWKKDAQTQEPGARPKHGAQDYMPLVEGVNPGVGGSLPEATSGKSVKQEVPSEEQSQEGDEDAESKRAEVLV
jgi:hypothetical protein